MLTGNVTEITTASQEQAAGIEQVHQAVAHMDQVTQQNAALVEEVAAASESMRDQSGDLAGAVSIFKLAAAAREGAAPARPAAGAHLRLAGAGSLAA